MKATGLVAGVGAFLCVGAVCFGVWYMGFRDNWESDNSIRIKDLSSNTLALVELGKKDEAKVVANKLRELVGDRPLEMPELRSAYERACAAVPAPAIAVAATPTPPAPKPAAPSVPVAINKPVTVSGGAWITMKSGSSTPLRGLSVALVEQNAVNSDVIHLYEDELLGTAVELQSATESIVRYKKYIQEQGEKYWGSSLKQAQADELRLQAKVKTQQEAFNRMKANPSEPISLVEQVKRFGERAITGAPSCVLATAYTDIDGKYTIECPRRDVFLFAHFAGTNTITWIIPLKNEREVKIDLFNDTAWDIKNAN